MEGRPSAVATVRAHPATSRTLHPCFNAPTRPAPGVVVGLGNTILSDDGVGPHVVSRISPALALHPELECVELSLGGLALLDVLRDRRWAVLVDCLDTGDSPPGTIRRLSERDVRGSARLVSYHDLSYPMALRMGRVLGWSLPTDVVIIGIEGRNVNEFGSTMSPVVERACDRAARIVEGEIERRIRAGPPGGGSRDGPLRNTE